MMVVRKPAVAGKFYDSDPARLIKSIERTFEDNVFGPGRLPVVSLTRQFDLLGLFVPHAAYIYSGAAAAQAYSRMGVAGLPDTVVLLGPNHQGYGAPFAVQATGCFETPLGRTYIDEDLMAEFLVHLDYFSDDPGAHQLEHSLEVQVPFLQYIAGNRLKIAPILISVHPFDSSEDDKFDEISDVLAQLIETHNALLIVSTDLSHYHHIDLAKQLDRVATRAIMTLDGKRLLATVREYEISMCGAIPTALGMMAMDRLNARDAALLSYYTSGDVAYGDTDRVVGYSSIEVCR